MQETTDSQSRDGDYANRSMVSCMHDRVPIGVMRQITETPVSRYHILGAALVVGRYEGHFHIEGFSVDGFARGVGSIKDLGPIIVSQEKLVELTGAFSPNDIIDAREKTLASIIRRRGQPTFRQKMLAAYNGECAITGCNVEEALEAVHILPYRGPQTNHPSNGLLLRADIHILFDLGLIAIDPAGMNVLVSPSLYSTTYAWLAGKSLRLPEEEAYKPSVEFLRQHRAWTGL